LKIRLIFKKKLRVSSIVKALYEFKKNNLEIESWKKWYVDLVLEKPKPYTGGKNKQNVEHNDEIAVEVYVYRKALRKFGGLFLKIYSMFIVSQNSVIFLFFETESAVTRSPRPSKIMYRTGQVIRHKKYNVYGVIIGWDEYAQAPDQWLERNYKAEEVFDRSHYNKNINENKYENVFL
jgi:hypothetical protein